MIRIFNIFFLLIFFPLVGFSQVEEEAPRWIANFSTELLPPMKLQGANNAIQQFNGGLGYQCTDNISVTFNSAYGILGKTNTLSGYDSKFISLALGSDYMFRIGNSSRLGFELMAGSGLAVETASNLNKRDYNFLYYRAGIKVECYVFFSTLGVRKRDFYVGGTNSEIFFAIGAQFHFPREKSGMWDF